MKLKSFSITLACTSFVAVLALLAAPRVSNAQIFCPTSVTGQSGIALSGGTCTNVNPANGTGTGAFSNAALASQALSDLSQSTTQETTRTAVSAISERRQAEAERCPDGMERVGGVCRRPEAPEAAPAAARPQSSSVEPGRRPSPARRQGHVQRTAVPAAPVYKAPPVPIIDQGVRLASWAQVFGDYERRTGSGSANINCCFALGAPVPNALVLSAESRASSIGFVGGLDATVRNVLSQGDGFIAGALVGYAETDFRVTTTSTSLTANVGNGSSILTARLTGPSVGAFVTYFNGGFSVDNTFKVDFLGLNENFTDNLAFTANVPNPFPSPLVPFATFSGAGSTSLTNYNSFGNINYRYNLTDRYWVEPTAGYNYTSTKYGSNAALLGLSDGDLLRLQAGARFGVESVWNRVRVTTVLTGLAYDDVIVSGGVVQNAAFGLASQLLLAQQGRVRGQGILAFNFDFGRGLSTFLMGDVRGGEGLFGAGGKAGIRYQW